MIDEVRKMRATIRALEERCAVLEEANALLEEELRRERYGDAEWRAPSIFRLTPKEEACLRALLARDWCTKEQILDAVYSLTEDVPGIKIIDVFICKLRAKLRPHGLEIATIWGQGYELTPDARARLQAWGGG